MIWFDLDNTPHVPLFRGLIHELLRRGLRVLVTSRKHAQTEDLLALWNIEHQAVGVHGGKSRLQKVLNLGHRSGQLLSFVKGKPIHMGMSHGSRTHLLAASALRIPYVWMTDYEYSEHHLANALADRILVPSVIPETRLAAAGFKPRKIVRYNGFKEEIYLPDFVPDPGLRKSLGIDESVILVTIRPPSTSANYHDRRSEALFEHCLRVFTRNDQVHCLVVNRTAAESKMIPPELMEQGRIQLLSRPVDGLQLIWTSDIVVSGGGTMNRESALLGVPTYSIFTGQRPYMDEHLQALGKLEFIETPGQVEQIPLRRRDHTMAYVPMNKGVAAEVAQLVLSFRKGIDAEERARL